MKDKILRYLYTNGICSIKELVENIEQPYDEQDIESAIEDLKAANFIFPIDIDSVMLSDSIYHLITLGILIGAEVASETM